LQGRKLLSAREQQGFRGPVKSCAEEVIHSRSASAEGAEVQRSTRKTIYEFDRDGRLISYQGIDGGSGWINENVYDAEGRFLKSTSSSGGNVYHEIEYRYDESGRLLSYTAKSRDGLISSVCVYDGEAHKTVTTSFDAKVLESTRKGASAGPRLGAVQSGVGVPDGGTVRTRYDAGDRPIEAEVLSLDGQVVSRVVLTYDDEGRLVEEKQILENPESMIPANVRAQMLLAGGSLEELRTQLSKFSGGESGQHVISYEYDPEGRVIQRRTRIAPYMQQTVTMTYNPQGDVVEEVWEVRGAHGAKSDEHGNVVPDRPIDEPTIARRLHSYVYDEQGNWTEQIISDSPTSDGQFVGRTATRRTLTYY
jgi:YD repeat-containing protein